MLDLENAYNELHREVLKRLTQMVLENQKPNEYWKDIETIKFEVGDAKFLTLKNDVLKPLDAWGLHINIDNFSIDKLIKFLNKNS